MGVTVWPDHRRPCCESEHDRLLTLTPWQWQHRTWPACVPSPQERRKAAKDAEYRKGTNVKGGQGEWKDLGGFEKYSKGIGSKLLAKVTTG